MCVRKRIRNIIMSSSEDLADDGDKKVVSHPLVYYTTTLRDGIRYLLQGLMLFGRDVSKIPCFRNSFLYGIGGGFAGGLLTFLFTSRPQLSTHSAMGVFMAVTFGYWGQCR